MPVVTRRWILCLLLLMGGAVWAQDAVIGTVAAARALPLQVAREGKAVRLTGVVTYLRDTEKDLNFNVHDTTGGVMVYPLGRTTLRPGQQVTVTGKTAVSVHGLRIADATVIPGEFAGLPAPKQTSMSEVLDGKWEGDFVEVEGIVRVVRLEGMEISPQRLALDFGSRRQRLTSWITQYDPQTNPAVPGTTVRVRGVPVRWKNPRGQTQSTSVLVNGMTDVDVLKTVAPPAQLPLEELLLWSTSDELGTRVSTRGVVTFHQPGDLTVVQDDAHAIRVRAMDGQALHRTGDAALSVGDQVEVVGFPVMGEYTVELEDAEWTRTGTGPVPPPEVIEDAAKVLSGPALVDRDGRLITVTANLRDLRERDGRRALEMVSGKVAFNAWLPLETELPDEVRTGSELRLTGICTLHLTDSQRRYGRPPGFFSLQLAGADSLQVVRAGPWWTGPRLALAMAAVGIAALVTAVWAGGLRKRNRMLRAEMDARERAERELSTERRRVAGELHDTMEQTLVAAALQLNAAARTLATKPETAADQLALARQLVARSRQEVRDAVWDLRVGEVQAEPLSTLLCRVCEESTDTASVTFAMEGEERPIPGLVTAQAIRLVREAIANALKHAEPDTVQVTMRMDAERLHLQVKDDGKGFDPAKAPGADRGHFGLSGMAERIERLGGTMQITSAPGAGATFDFSIPLPKS